MKIERLYLPAALIASVVIAGSIYLNYGGKRLISSRLPRTHDRVPPLEDLSIPFYDDQGRKSFLLNIKRCELREKKIGFYTLAFSKVAQLTGVQIDIYSWQAQARTNDVGRGNGAPDAMACLEQLPRSLRWNEVRDLEIKRVIVNLYDEEQLVSTVRADKLIPGSAGNFIFQGDVVLATADGTRTLTSESVVWLLKTRQFALKGVREKSQTEPSHRSQRLVVDWTLNRSALTRGPSGRGQS